ncbi:hypothetical protein BGX24_010241 [Mortierella sp. AD032]|nr:hypothetical protein BGX24_010241 [Mortierella sp. AD032]
MHQAEQGRLRRLTTQVAVQFLDLYRKRETSIAEVSLLASVFDRQDYREVLSSLIERFDEKVMLNLELLRGLVYFLQSASSDYLIDDDLVRILGILRNRLEKTHMQPGSSQHIHLLVIAISRVLDVMVEGKVNGLRRIEDHDPLLQILASLMSSPDRYLKHQATYAWQALQYIGDDEPPLQMAMRVGGQLAVAGSGVVNAFKLDIGGLFDGLRVLVEAASQALNFTRAVTENARTARDAGAGVVDSFLEGFRAGVKRAWYPALQGARVFIREGRLADFEHIVYNAPCCHEQDFQWGICQLLGEIALDPIWGMEICRQAVRFLEDLNGNDSGWIGDTSVRGAIRGILRRISESPEILIHVNSLSQDPKWDNGINSEEPYPLITRLSIPESSPLLAKALKTTSLEDKLGRIMAQQLKTYQQNVYIPPNAKANPLVSYDNPLVSHDNLLASDDNLLASDDNPSTSVNNPLAAENKCFPLMDMVTAFLQSEQQVFLILGDSGSGKSTFNKHLSYVLTVKYKQGGPIPIFIDLRTAKDPKTGLVSEYLKTFGFTDEDVQELKQDRQFILICDAYDEMRLRINLHTSNMLNRHNEWKTQMIISCRSNKAALNYHDLFQPQLLDWYDPSTPHPFQAAVIVAFSKSQIENYVNQFVGGNEVHTLFPDRPVWSAAEYMDKLNKIENLLELATNPFLLSLSLRWLPGVFKDGLDSSTAPTSITGPRLIGFFIKAWLKVSRKRLLAMDLCEEIQEKLEVLDQEGFIEIAIKFLRDLAAAMLLQQKGDSVVHYKHSLHKDTWKASFFGPDEKIKLLREASPLVSMEDRHSFMHRSLLEYFVGLYMCSEQNNKQQTHLSWFHHIATAAGATVVGAGTIAVGAGALAIGAVHGAGRAAFGALTKVDGVWKRTVQVLTTRKAHVDSIAPIAKTSYVYYDDDVYDAVLVEKSTGVTYVTQLLFDSTTAKYYVYVRWGETDYRLDGPHETVESAKAAFQVTYHEQFGVQWQERETTVSERWTYEVKTYETFDSVEEVEEIVEESEAIAIIERQREPATTARATQEDGVLEHVGEDVVVDKNDVNIVKEIGEAKKPAVPKDTSWFRRLVTSADATVFGTGDGTHGAEGLDVGTVHDDSRGTSNTVSGTLTKVNGVWKRTIQVITTRKVHVDSAASIARTSYVYYEGEEVYDAFLVEVSTGIIFLTQLLFDSSVNKYYVYIRKGPSDCSLDGPYDTIESSKEAFKIAYHKKFNAEWHDREIVVEDSPFKYKPKQYKVLVNTEEIEEDIEEAEALAIIEPEKEVLADDQVDIEVDDEDEIDVEVADDDVVNEEVMVDADVPSSSLLDFKISGTPASLGDMTIKRLVYEMSASPVFDDQTMGVIDLAEEPDILRFLVDQVEEDPAYTKMLLWTVYKSGGEGINQSTKNAMCILKKAGIQFHLQR